MTQHHPLPTLQRPEPTPDQPQDAQADVASSPSEGLEHLEEIPAAELDGAGGAGEQEAPPADGLAVGADGLLSAEAFAAGLRQALTITGHLTSLQTLLASPDQPTYQPAALSIYETIKAVPALHFLLRPGGIWLQRAAAIAVWAVPVAAGCKRELAERRNPVRNPEDLKADAAAAV